MDPRIIWLAEYTDVDIDPYARILDLGFPMPYGFVIPRSILHGIFLDLKTQEKLIPLFELIQHNNIDDINHARRLILKIIGKVVIPTSFSVAIHKGYEQIYEKERQYLKLKTHDLHRAIHVLKHVYSPPTVNITFLPKSNIELLATGEQSLIDTIIVAIIANLENHLVTDKLLKIPSIMVQRLTNGQYSGYCQTTNSAHKDTNQIVIYANHGAKMLDESADVYIISKDTVKIRSKHLLTQPYKYVLKNGEYRKVNFHEEDGGRQVLHDSLISQIAYMAKDIEKKLYFPQKIYWTFENGNLFVTRLRQL